MDERAEGKKGRKQMQCNDAVRRWCAFSSGLACALLFLDLALPFSSSIFPATIDLSAARERQAKTSASIQLSLSSRGPVWLQSGDDRHKEAKSWGFARDWTDDQRE